MPIADWNTGTLLGTVYGDLPLNATSGYQYLLVPSGCDMWQDVRAQQSNIPQGDGSLIQERFDTGTRLKLLVALWYNDAPACNDQLTTMVDTLSKYAHSLVKAAWSGRFYWDPDNAAIRMLDYMQMSQRMEWDWSNPDTRVTLVFDSPFPYCIDFTQISTNIAGGGSAALNNTGNTTMYPVFKVNGPATSWTLSNDTTGLAIVYNDALPGADTIPGGSYLEIDTFRNVAYLNGTGANYKDGIDINLSDFFGLVPGNNVISLSAGAASVDVLWQAAWV